MNLSGADNSQQLTDEIIVIGHGVLINILFKLLLFVTFTGVGFVYYRRENRHSFLR